MLLEVMTTMINVMVARVSVVGLADELEACWEGRKCSIENIGKVKFRC
jgi:hypothetical protein